MIWLIVTHLSVYIRVRNVNTLLNMILCKFVLARICGAVSEYYVKQFVYHWKEKTRGCRGKNQESNTNTVVAALLIERAGDFNWT